MNYNINESITYIYIIFIINDKWLIQSISIDLKLTVIVFKLILK